jgi:hypothetical protein
LQPEDTLYGPVAITIPIGVYQDYFASVTTWPGGDTWSWTNATPDFSQGGGGYVASAPSFVWPTNCVVKATYHGEASAGVTCTVVCPNESVKAGSPICYNPLGGDDPYWPLYAWGGTFNYTYTWVDQSGNTNSAAGLRERELQPVVGQGSTCPYGDFLYDQTPTQLQSDTITDYATETDAGPPNSDCYITTGTELDLGATNAGPWSCPYVHIVTITQSGQNPVTITTSLDTQAGSARDEPCTL